MTDRQTELRWLRRAKSVKKKVSAAANDGRFAAASVNLINSLRMTLASVGLRRVRPSRVVATSCFNVRQDGTRDRLNSVETCLINSTVQLLNVSRG